MLYSSLKLVLAKFKSIVNYTRLCMQIRLRISSSCIALLKLLIEPAQPRDWYFEDSDGVDLSEG